MWSELTTLVNSKDLAYSDFYVNDTVNVAVAALMVHMAFADGEFHQDELDMIRDMLHDRFGYSDTIIDDLIISTGVTGNEYVDIHSFIDTIKTNFNDQELRDFFKTIWHIIMADGKIHPYEQRIANILAARFNIGMTEHEEIKCAAIREGSFSYKCKISTMLEEN
jgi:uncharacterized tellurite resistance protein B-like protein